jgi:hypothetical protein
MKWIVPVIISIPLFISGAALYWLFIRGATRKKTPEP